MNPGQEIVSPLPAVRFPRSLAALGLRILLPGALLIACAVAYVAFANVQAATDARLLAADAVAAGADAVRDRAGVRAVAVAGPKDRLAPLIRAKIGTGNSLARAYAQTGGFLFFTDDGRPRKNFFTLMAHLETVHLDGLDPAPYDVASLRRDFDALRAKRSALIAESRLALTPTERDLLLSRALGRVRGTHDPADLLFDGPSPRYASVAARQAVVDRLAGELLDLAARLDVELALRYRRLAADLDYPSPERIDDGLVRSIAVPEMTVRVLEPPIAMYEGLRTGLARYLRMRNAGGFVALPFKTKLELGAQGPDVTALQVRLRQEGFFISDPTGNFDEETQLATARFQERHGLLADGVVGPRTVQMANIPLDEKIRRLRTLITRLRRATWRREPYFVRVNIPGFELQVVENGKVVRAHRVVVGNRNPIRLDPENKLEVPKRYNTTPVLTGWIEALVFNPAWYVPDRIKDEIDRTDVKKDPEYLEKHDFVIVTDEEGNQRYYQEGGSKFNALGQVKILFPNEYSVYMHDTPMRGLFQRAHRDYSHGCIRVQDAVELARFLLKKDGHPEAGKVDAIIGVGKRTRTLSLRRRVPIYIEYETVSADADGNVTFYEDLYNYAAEGPVVGGKRRL